MRELSDWPFCEQVEDLLGWGEGAVGVEEHVDVGGLQLTSVAGQGVHQLLQASSLQIGSFIVWNSLHRET